MRVLLYVALAFVGVQFTRAWRRQWGEPSEDVGPRGGAPSITEALIGLITNFFDTLGIGSFAPTTSLFRLTGTVPDRAIPGTLMIGHTWPTLAQAFIYITIIEVDLTTLLLLISASVAGSWLGAGLVARWSKRQIRGGMGVALIVAAAIFIATALGLLPGGGDAVALHGVRLAVGLIGNFIFGALMTIGIGAYAPSLILFGLLGMNLKSVFPVMMGSCAFLMPVGGLRFLREGNYAPRAALGLTLGGVPGVLLAAFLVREMSIDLVRWLVVAVVLYTAATMLRAARRNDP